MSYCPKCGAKIEEEMAFCPRCGAPLKVAQVQERRVERRIEEKAEKREKKEKREKGEKHEKYEKREFGFIGPLVGGLILIFFGLMFYLQVAGYRVWEFLWASFLIIAGLIIIVAVIYASTIARRRYPKP